MPGSGCEPSLTKDDSAAADSVTHNRPIVRQTAVAELVEVQVLGGPAKPGSDKIDGMYPVHFVKSASLPGISRTLPTLNSANCIHLQESVNGSFTTQIAPLARQASSIKSE